MSALRRVYEQSAVIPYRRHGGRLEVLVITTSDGRRWGVPKGLVEPGLTPPESAAREAEEEAGARGAVSSERLGEYTYPKWGGTCRVEVFPLHVEEVLARWQEGHRAREWLGVDEAAARVSEPGLKELVRRLPGVVSG